MELRHAQGVQIGQGNVQHNYFLSGQAAISAYLHQVQRIAPPFLAGRDEELAELAAFCRAGDGTGYMWWRGRAWAGKSALMSWFVLHPPPGTRVVSFFITARFAGQNDRVAFTEVVIEQLAQLLDQPVPASLSPSTRDSHFLDLLYRAAGLCQARGEHLVLVVDGLDEDRGVVAGPDAYSIAALLPAQPPAGLRIVVSGRPNPPIPADVPAGHPLRRGDTVRPLAASPVAQVVRTDAERELKLLLRGEQIEQDLLGLVVAAGGGLSARDLTQLTDRLEWEIDERLGAVSGRTFRPRDSTLGPDRPDVFVLAHEELQQAATVYFGPARLDGYAARLRQWAEDHRRRGWPPETPDYLLGGYFAMLQARDELPEMVALATDRRRQDRMAELTSSDASALTELAHCLSGLAAAPEPDLVTMARLAMHRHFLHWRGAEVPGGMPELLLRLGYRQRAAGVLRSIGTRFQRDHAFARFIGAAMQTGDGPWAERWWCSSWPSDRGADELQERRRLLAETLIKQNQPEMAARIAEALTDPDDRLRVAELLDEGPVFVQEPRPAEEPADDPSKITEEEMALLLGRPFPVPAEDIERALRSIEAARAGRWRDADELAQHIGHWQHREQTRRRIAIVALLDGWPPQALEPGQAEHMEWEAFASLLADPESADVDRGSIAWPDWMWEEALGELVHRGELQRAHDLAAFPSNPRARSHLFTELAIMLVEEHPERAKEIAQAAGALARTVHRSQWIFALGVAVTVLDRIGRADHARALLARALPLLTQTAELDRDARFDIMLMRASAAEDRERPALLADAIRFAEAGDDEVDLRDRLGSVAQVAAGHRHHALAGALLRRINAIEPDRDACAALAAIAIRQGLPSIARDYLRVIPSVPARLEAILGHAAWTLMESGDPEAVRGITEVAVEVAAASPDEVSEPLRAGIDCLLALCDGDDHRAEALAGFLPDPVAGWVHAELAGRWAARGEMSNAEELLASTSDIHVAARMVGALAARGEVQRALDLATSAVPYGEGDILSRASAQCGPEVARRLMATAFVYHGYWETTVAAAARLEPAVATAVADEIVALMEP